jgi:uncharacterized LabA/DUF88 family protein
VAVTNVYVDGFNLYNGRLKNTPYKWLDLLALMAQILPAQAIQRMRYFTAMVKPPPGDPQQRQRQETYLRALATFPEVSIHRGHFLRKTVRMPLVTVLPPTTPGVKIHADGRQSIEVVKTEEKGSDVNLATYLVVDAFRKDFDVAVIVSNDGDLKEPIRLVQQELGLQTIVVNPHPRRLRSVDLRGVCGDHRNLRTSAVKAAQLPTELHDANGTIHKPGAW